MENESVKMELNRKGNKRGIHPNSLANLEKRKGQGRPRNELSLTNLAREKLDEVCPYDPEGRTWKEYLVDRWLAHSLVNVTYFRELTERLEGKILQPIGGENGKPIKYEISVKDGESRELTEQLFEGSSVVSHIGLS